MARYIDADMLLKELDLRETDTTIQLKQGDEKHRLCQKGILSGLNWSRNIIYAVPTADVAEVKHGYNATDMHPVDEFVCSECGFICNDFTEAVYDEDGEYTYYRECEFKYCPKCGAKMDKEKEY